jgi:hypothetical protein
MRVIRTDLYLDQRLGNYPFAPAISPIAKAISTAWFQSDDKEVKVSSGDLRDIIFSMTIPVPRKEAEFKEFLTECLQEGFRGRYLEELGFRASEEEVEEAYKMEVVLERSPPVTMPLSQLMTQSPGIAIGTYVGLQIGPDHSPMMLVSVVGGILAVSSAIGVARALEKGLQDRVATLLRLKGRTQLAP